VQGVLTILLNSPSNMKKNKTKRSAYLAWLGVILCSLAIFSTVPIARSVQRYVSNRWGRQLFGYFVLIVLAIGCISLLYYLLFKLRIRSFSKYAWLILITCLYVYFTLQLWQKAEEAIHFLEYGLLSLFVFRALSFHIRDRSIYFTAALICLLIGTFDEIIQWMVPERFWDFRDVWLNGLSGGLFQLAIWKVIKPKIISEKMSLRSLRKLSAVFAACLLLLGLCASNTPHRVGVYANLIPGLSFLQREEMSEFGYKHKDPEIGQFYSRLSVKSLRKIDSRENKENSRILNRNRKTEYRKFLQQYNPHSNPFLHELRVHLFRRDTYFQKAKEEERERPKKESYFIAYKENVILQKYFTQTTKNSPYWWSEERVDSIKRNIDTHETYTSAVSAGLFTTFTEGTQWIVIFIVLLLLTFLNIYLSHRSSRVGKPEIQ
jgi:VanZ family protein